MVTKIYDHYMKNNDKDIDNNFLNKSFQLMIENEKELAPYINDFKLLSNDLDALGTYSIEDREITIDVDKINNHNASIITNKALIGIEVIRHEMEHARNLKRLLEGRDDIESFVVKCALKDYAIRHNLDYSYDYDLGETSLLSMRIHDNYDTNPGERIAEIKAWKYLVNLLKNRPHTNDLLTARSMLFYSYIRGYEKDNYLDAPTLSFLLETEMFHDLLFLKRKNDKKKYSLDTRLLCGLPITQNEYDNEILQKVRLKKRYK